MTAATRERKAAFLIVPAYIRAAQSGSPPRPLDAAQGPPESEHRAQKTVAVGVSTSPPHTHTRALPKGRSRCFPLLQRQEGKGSSPTEGQHRAGQTRQGARLHNRGL